MSPLLCFLCCWMEVWLDTLKQFLEAWDKEIPCLPYHLLCVYLFRILHKISTLDQFYYHPRCKEVKLTHMCFADDLIMCCKGEFAAAYLMLKAFKLFSYTLWLKANVNKSVVYSCGMSKGEIKIIEHVSGFLRRKLPIKYLVVPICSKKIWKAQCDLLIGKLTAQIRLWSTRILSYSARNQLINDVLLSLH